MTQTCSPFGTEGRRQDTEDGLGTHSLLAFDGMCAVTAAGLALATTKDRHRVALPFASQSLKGRGLRAFQSEKDEARIVLVSAGGVDWMLNSCCHVLSQGLVPKKKTEDEALSTASHFLVGAS